MKNKTMIMHDPASKQDVLSYIENLPLDKAIEVTLSPYRNNRTNAQNRLMWAWLHELEDQTGNDAEALHVFFKARFLGVKDRVVFNMKLKTTQTTTKLNTKEFTEYLKKIELLASENGYKLSQPHYYDLAMKDNE